MRVQNINAPMGSDDPVDLGLDRLIVGNVQPRLDRLQPLGLQVFDHQRGLLGVQICHHHLRTMARHGHRTRPANA